ncbi:hypothetical protein [Devosia sp. A449]
MNVFVAANDRKTPHELLVLPWGPLGGIPDHLQHLDWRNLATTMTDDKLLGNEAERIKAEIASKGYAIVRATE